MSGIFRFSNAVSDISKFIATYKRLYSKFIETTKKGGYFTHTDAATFLATEGLASSLGAIGQEALIRSTRDDKSRDPLYNQHKSYSEMFRMLGWYEPGSKQTNFKLSEYGEYIFEAEDELLKKLVALNVLHIVSPNPLTNVKGLNVLRPFPLIIKLMNNLDGKIHRDEIILAVLACENDRKKDILTDLTMYIKSIREGGKSKLIEEMDLLRKANNIESLETLPNYTRFPISAIKWNGWAESKSVKGIYGSTSSMLEITESGKLLANELSTCIDIRYKDIESFSIKEKASFTVWSNLYQLGKVGFNVSDYSSAIRELEYSFINILDVAKIDKPILYFGYQESPRDIIIFGDKILNELL